MEKKKKTNLIFVYKALGTLTQKPKCVIDVPQLDFKLYCYLLSINDKREDI